MFKLVAVPEYQSKDVLIDLIRRLIFTLGSLDRAMKEAEDLINEHQSDPSQSRLSRLLPHSLGTFFTPLHLVSALQEYDEQYAIRQRTFIPPSFSEVRHILNLAQLRALCGSLKMITFDADGTIYDDGSNLEIDNPIIQLLIRLLEAGMHVAIITAAGYPRDPTSYEKRFSALMNAFRAEGKSISSEALSRFYVVGGECNYLFRTTTNPASSSDNAASSNNVGLEFVHGEAWLMPSFLSHSEEDISHILDEACMCIEETKRKLKVQEKFKILRKERAVGMVRVDSTYTPRRECLDEIASAVQNCLQRSAYKHIPFCAFNGGKDVWVDIGHKSIAVESLMDYLKLSRTEVLHIGDQMSKTGNDYRARSSCATLWIANPKETRHLLRLFLQNQCELYK